MFLSFIGCSVEKTEVAETIMTNEQRAELQRAATEEKQRNWLGGPGFAEGAGIKLVTQRGHAQVANAFGEIYLLRDVCFVYHSPAVAQAA